MTYSESAEGIFVSYARAEREVLWHEHEVGSEEFTEFLVWFRDNKTSENKVSAGALLGWLGY